MESDGRDGVSDTGRKCCIFTSPVNQDLVELFHFHKPGGRQRFYQMVFFLFFGGFWRVFFGGMNNISELNHYICTFSLQ